MKQAQADDEVAAMKAVLATLIGLQAVQVIELPAFIRTKTVPRGVGDGDFGVE
jgi:hypothetical protein